MIYIIKKSLDIAFQYPSCLGIIVAGFVAEFSKSIYCLMAAFVFLA
jgi:hypothetical protein